MTCQTASLPLNRTGQGLGWEGLLTADSVTYERMGIGSESLPDLSDLRMAVPRTVDFDSQYSNFTFAAGPVELTGSFLSPVIPTDLCRTSIPLAYLTVTARSTDNAAHSIQLYNDINGAWAAFESNATLTWDIYEAGLPVNGTNVTASVTDIYSWIVQLQNQYEFGEESDRNLWSNFSFNSAQGTADRITFNSGYAATIRYNYIMQHVLTDLDDDNYRGYGAQDPVFAYSHDFGTVPAGQSASATYTLGSIQQPPIR